MKGHGAVYLCQLIFFWKKLEQKLSIDEIEKKVKKTLVCGTYAHIFINFRTNFLWIQKQQKPLVEGTYGNFF